MNRKIIKIQTTDATAKIFGSYDRNAILLENHFGVTIRNRSSESGDSIVIEGESEVNVSAAAQCISYLQDLSGKTDVLSEQSVQYAIDMVAAGQGDELSELGDECICVTTKGKPIKAKTVGQKRYVESIRKNTIVLGVGPAGTGKTFLAVAMAVRALREKQVSRIILTRPAIEAGEKLGFLPGDLQSKIDPYLRPLYDALYEMMGAENYQRLVEKGTIEIAPLAYMRGRTLDDSFIILDEAQNATPDPPPPRPLRGHSHRHRPLRHRRRADRGPHFPHRRGLPHEEQGGADEPPPLLLLLGSRGGHHPLHPLLSLRGH